MTDNRGQVKDAPILPVTHARDRMFCGQERTPEIHINNARPLWVLHFPDDCVVVKPRCIDEYVNLPRPTQDLAEHVTDLVFEPQVGVHGEDILSKGLGQSVRLSLVFVVVNCDPMARRGVCSDKRLTEIPRAPEDERGITCQVPASHSACRRS